MSKREPKMGEKERVTQSTATVVVVVAELSSSSSHDGYGRNANVTR